MNSQQTKAEENPQTPEPETEAAPAETEAPPEPVEPDPAAALQEENAQLKSRLLRLQADFENHRKRAAKEQQQARQYGHENFARELLGSLDNLERALAHCAPQGKGAKGQGKKLAGVREGMELVQRELQQTLAKYGVREIAAAEGAPFNPNFHEAIAHTVHAQCAPNTIAEVTQRGYQLHERMLRPARVVVAKAPPAKTAADESAPAESAGETSQNESADGGR